MKKSDIKVGGEYAYNRSEYGSAERVKVLSTDARIQQGYGYGRKFITGSRVQVLDSRTGKPAVRKNAQTGEEVERVLEVANRTLREPWVDYAERNAAMAKARRDSDRQRLEGRRGRAGFLLDLIPALRHAGFLDTTTTVYDNETVQVLREQVPDCIEFIEEGMRGWQFTAPLPRALAEHVQNGASIPVPASELLRILDGKSIR